MAGCWVLMSDPARVAAYTVLRAVAERDAYVNLLLPAVLRGQGLTGRDAAFATELTHGTLRRRGTYDAVLDSVATGGMARIDDAVLDILRLGTHQLLSMRVADHAAVSTTVQLVREQVGHRPAGFANAVLRRVAARSRADWIAHLTADLTDASDDALAVATSHPAWIVAALREALAADPGTGPESLGDLLAAHNEPARVTLAALPGLSDPADLPGEPGRWSPWARRLTEGGDPGDVDAVRAGRAIVADEGSQLVALTLAEAVIESTPKPDGSGERWLDLCAGPGGKAALLGAVAAGRGATLTANEVQPHRAELVRRAVRAVGGVEIAVHDGRAGPWAPGSFDRVLVDVPCTGLGALRRRPEARWRRTPADLDTLLPLQAALLRRAVELVRPGGVVVYATCSPHVAETHQQIAALTAEGDDVEVERVDQWWPHLHGTDAMVAATLRRR